MINELEIVVPTLFGVEAVAAREIRNLGYETTSVTDGRITFKGDPMAVCRANVNLRSGERVLVKIGEFKATTFEELFEQTKKLPWSDWITKHVAFPVKGFSIKSKLFSVSDCQAIIKKSIVESLKDKYKVDWFDEHGAVYQIQFGIIRDVVTLMIDTSGSGLHKRGYRKQSNKAPLRETVAAAMIMLSFWRNNRTFADPFCGSGTIPIEAAMIGRNIAPGLSRSFAGEKFSQIDRSLWDIAREEARENIKQDAELDIFASDLDVECAALTKQNAVIAGVGEDIRVSAANALDFAPESDYGILISNPPYGERLGSLAEAEKLYRDFGKVMKKYPTWSYYLITSDENIEKCVGRRADKKRKVYNGMLKCDYYQFYAPKKK